MIVLYHNAHGALRHGRDVSSEPSENGAWVLNSNAPRFVPAARIYGRAETWEEAERLYYEHNLADCALCAECDAWWARQVACG